MNNKGQALVMFILLLPLITALIALVIDSANITIEKQKSEIKVEDAIKYGLKHIDEENIEEKINILLEDDVLNVNTLEIDDKKIKIIVEGKMKSLFSSIFKDKYEIYIKHLGYIEDGKIVIE